MKVPISTPQSCITNTITGTSKPLSCDDNTPFQGPNSTLLVSHSYEPTSVLDIQRSLSPIPTTAPPQHHHPSLVDLDNSEVWDSILSELGFNDDSSPSSPCWSQFSSCDSDLPHDQLPDLFPTSHPFDHNLLPINLSSDASLYDIQNFNPNFGPLDLPYHHQSHQNVNSYGLDFIDDLIQAAQSFESNDSTQVHLTLARLNQRLRSPAGKPLQRTAFYFKEALQRLDDGPTQPGRMSSLEVVHTIRAFKAFSGISPVSLFSAFAANQAILEAVDGSAFVHIIDFDIGFGCHWASFMRELVDKFNPTKLGSMVLRITVIIPDELGNESTLVTENLTQFARELNINFYIDFVTFQSFEISSFESVMFIEGERLAVHLSPNVFHRVRNSRIGISKFLADLRGISPRVVVVVDQEVGIDTGTASFSMNFIAGMEFYTGMMESLDVAATAGGLLGGGDWVKRIEMYVLRPRITAAVKAAVATAAGQRTTWREAFVEAGMRAVGFSQFADFQAECLLRRVQIGGFHAAKRHGEMMLYWHDRALVATSAWSCFLPGN